MSKISKKNQRRQKFTQNNPSTPQSQEEQFKDYARQMATSASSNIYNPLYGTGLTPNPIWMNTILKQMTSSPQKYDRDKVLKLLENPVYNEKALKDLHQYLLNNSQHYKRLIDYFATLLTFDYLIVPTNADEDDMKTKSFKKSYKTVLNWLENFNIKKEFGDIMKIVLGEDAGFYYLRENEDEVFLQRMPTDYCMIVNRTELGFQYAFNMTYFLNPGVRVEDFAPEFKEYRDNFMAGDTTVQYFWQVLDPTKAWCFKWDENDAGIILPMLGLFLDAIEISEFKALLKTKTALENWKILFQKIPMKEDKDAKPNQYLLDPTDAGKYHANIKAELPPGASVLTTPMNVEAIDFQQAENRSSIVGLGEQNFYSSAGSSPILFGASVNSAVGLAYSVQTDEAFVMHMYRQFERFINYNLKQVSGKYRFKLVFPDLTIFNKDKVFERAIQGAQFGYPKTLVATTLGFTPGDLQNLTAFENSMGMIDKLIPLQSSHTATVNDGGRPQSTGQLSEGGAKQREVNGNQSRAE